MRRAIALLLVALPASALAQPAAPPAPQSPTTKPPSRNAPTHAMPSKPRPAAAAPAKPAHAAPHVPAVRSPAKPASPQHGAAPKPAPAPALAPPIAAVPSEPPKGSVTGLPLPRFAALRSDDINFRSGPGTRYPIEWVYKRRDLPVEIEREFETWRLVRDQEGTKGWVQQAMLVGRRTVVVTGGERVLRASADAASAPVAKLKPGVILRLRSCEAASDWCQASSGDYRGWILRSEVWGVMPGEAIQ